MRHSEGTKKEFGVYGEDSLCMFHAEWFNGRLDLGINPTFFLTSEESMHFAEWMIQSKPKKGWKITEIFSDKPYLVYTVNPDGLDNSQHSSFSIEEVWE